MICANCIHWRPEDNGIVGECKVLDVFTGGRYVRNCDEYVEKLPEVEDPT